MRDRKTVPFTKPQLDLPRRARYFAPVSPHTLRLARRERLRRRTLAACGAGLIVLGGPVGIATPMLPVGFLVSGFGAGLVVRNSRRGRRVVEGVFDRYPSMSGRVPPKVRRMIFG